MENKSREREREESESRVDSLSSFDDPLWFGDSGLGCNENSRIEDCSTNKERIIVPINKRV